MPVPFIPQIVAAGCSDIGCVRPDNQDAWLADAEHGLFIVADGIAGRPAGAMASQFVTSALSRVLARRSASLLTFPKLNGLPRRAAACGAPCARHGASASPTIGVQLTTGTSFTQRSRARAVRYVLRESILEVGREIRKTGADNPDLRGMGATIVAVWLRGPFTHVAHMGDSRAYLLRGGVLAPLTADHSIVALLKRNGEITEEEAQGHPAGGSLTRFVGMEGDVYPDTRSLRLDSGDRLLLCTDGMWSAVPDAELSAVLLNHPEPETACQELISLAKQQGGRDNITAVIVAIG